MAARAPVSIPPTAPPGWLRDAELFRGVGVYIVCGRAEQAALNFLYSEDFSVVRFKHQGWREPVDVMHHGSTKLVEPWARTRPP